MKLTKEEEQQLKSDNGAKLSDIEEKLIHSMHHKLEREYESKQTNFHSNQPKAKAKQDDKEVENSKYKR